MNRLSLAATGWVDQHPGPTGPEPDLPIGNRLRWSWPEDAAEGEHRILPPRLLLERAPIDVDVDLEWVKQGGQLPGPALFVPQSLWLQHGDVTLTGFMPVELDVAGLAGGPVQAVRFVYDAWFGGMSAVIEAFEGDKVVLTQTVDDGDLVVLHGAAVDRLTIMAPRCVLRQLATLDLYAPTGLSFDVIAELDLDKTATAGLPAVQARYPAPPTLDAGRWAALQDLWNAAWAEAPGSDGPNGGPNAWESLQLAVAARWEHAVCCGLGFVDGPGHAEPEIDTWTDLLGDAKGVAYRLRDPAERLAPSNIVCLPPLPAPALATLGAPSIENGSVRLGSSGAIRAAWDVAWTSPNVELVGARVEETIAAGTGTETETYDGRGRRDTDPPGAGFAHREEVVTSHQVTVTARTRAQDGFDRLGPWSPPTTATLPIEHYPQPPPFRTATHDGASATLHQTPPGGWVPDALVAAAGGSVRISRRVADPASASAPVVGANPTAHAILVQLAGAAPPNAGAFVGGQLTIGSIKGTVTALTWPWVTVEISHGDGPLPAIPSGSTAELLQSPTHAGLFVTVHTESAAGLPDSLVVADPLPPATEVEILEYRAQVVFAGRVGPFGGAVQAIRLPAIPAVPPPFTVTTLGVDFYKRTVVQLELTNPSSEPLEVWWAEGDVPAAEFARRAVPGDAGLRYAEGGSILFDTLSLPVPDKMDRIVTIGVQAANDADGRSDFAIVVHTLPK